MACTRHSAERLGCKWLAISGWLCHEQDGMSEKGDEGEASVQLGRVGGSEGEGERASLDVVGSGLIMH